MIAGFEKILLALLIFVLMAGMGATLTTRHFHELFRRPKALLIGFFAQFGWMPLIAFCLAHLLSLPPELAIGLIIMGCVPDGTTSNMFTYFSNADVALSISLTLLSTIAAVVVTPFVLYLYATPFTTSEIQIPYKSVVSTLLIMLIPVAIGVWVHRRSVPAARIVEKIGSYSGIVVLILLIGSGLFRNSELLARTSWKMYMAATGLGMIGLLLGYMTGAIFKLPVESRRAIAFQTGIQNSPLAFGVIVASFKGDTQTNILWLPMLYALMVLISSAVLTMWFRLNSKRHIFPSVKVG